MNPKTPHIKILGISILAFYKYGNSGWIRILGYGLSWKPGTEPKTFSERNGYKKTFTIKGYRFVILK